MTDHTKRPSHPTGNLSRRALQQRNQRVNLYRGLVTPIAVHYGRRCPEPLDDLVQVGLLGLLRAAELYQPQTTTPFEAFARPHIRGAILHYLRDSALVVRLPRRQMELHDKLRQLRASWCAQHGQEPSATDLRMALRLSPTQWQDLLRGQAMGRPMTFEPGGDEPLALWRLGSGLAEDESHLDQEPEEQRELLQRQLLNLEPGVRQVIQKVVLSGWTYRRTAARMQVSPMTVQRRLKRGLALLRATLTPPAAVELSSRRRPHPVASVAPAC
ncbi:sigma-70 family RNA polymerase sigma factor [Cyanobium sp. Alchichica 3B3-8F6]|uniref:sigma-70 family RNA polymerase sigma factor n=1 Tax=Cyanobium sp. Alchichica 3B3-8F6 TaxID=2823696 RepID=UPI0020CC5805|nr:sigma-70 family RNA polymerase sigma factor [Cyanobium sp. Alchichica 3B3-8F6]MCP9882135.1 sigma-70 family RNA polymerase sigma factor [Cyanobium sp. Alchichica 3B3-8F6]